MNLEALRGFTAVCRHGSFTKAANSLFLTQPAVSQQVKALEDELGMKLIEKQGQRIRLTYAGEVVRASAEEVFARLDQMVEVVDDIKGLRKGRLSVAAGDTVVMYLFPKWLKIFRKSFPGIELYLKGRMSVHVEDMVVRGEVDLGLITMPPTSAEVAGDVFRKEDLCLIFPMNDQFAGKKRIDLKAIAERPRIALGRGSATRRLIEAAFAARGLEWPPLMELPGFEIIKRYVVAGFGVAIIPRMVLKKGEGYITKNLPKNFPKQELGIIHRKGQYISKPLQSLIEIIKGG